MKEALTSLLKVKSIITILLTALMMVVILLEIQVQPEMMAMFTMSYGGIISFFFSKQKDADTITKTTMGDTDELEEASQ
jgi:uncharacterized Rmd1/YagE family protein